MPSAPALFGRSRKTNAGRIFSLDQTPALSRFRLPDDERGSKKEAKQLSGALLEAA
jgi:hypothetical protein